MIGQLFWALTLLACGFVAVSGGRDGRWAVLLIICASLLTIPATRLGQQWARTEHLILAVDLALLVGLYALALRTRRHFPMWMAGFQLIAVTTHLSTFIAPAFTPAIYRAMESLWAVPITLSMVLGVALDRRSGLLD